MEFVTVENKTLGKRTRVPVSRVKHLTDDWQVVTEETPPPRRKPAKKATPALAARHTTDPVDQTGEETVTPTDDGAAVAEQE